MRKQWADLLFWVLNALTLGVFAYLLIVSVWEIIREGFSKNAEAVGAIICWSYMVFSIILLTKYLIAPSSKRNLGFLWLSLGLGFLTFFIFLLILASIPELALLLE